MRIELFLGCVGLIALALTWLLGRSLIRRKRRPAAARRHQHHQQPLRERHTASLSRVHSHQTRVNAEHDIWKADRPRAAAERWQKDETLTAGYLRTDDELARESEDQVAMSVIEYVPTDLPRSGDRRSRAPGTRGKKG